MTTGCCSAIGGAMAAVKVVPPMDPDIGKSINSCGRVSFVHDWPSQYRCWSSVKGSSYQPAGIGGGGFCGGGVGCDMTGPLGGQQAVDAGGESRFGQSTHDAILRRTRWAHGDRSHASSVPHPGGWRSRRPGGRRRWRHRGHRGRRRAPAVPVRAELDAAALPRGSGSRTDHPVGTRGHPR